MRDEPPRHKHHHVLVSIHGTGGLDCVELDRPGPLRVLLHNHTGQSFPLTPRAGIDRPPTVTLELGELGTVELDPAAVRAPGWRAAGWEGTQLTVQPSPAYGWWLNGEVLAIDLGTVTVHGDPGLALVRVTLDAFGPGADGTTRVAVVRLPAGAAEGAVAASWVAVDADAENEAGVAVVTPRGVAGRQSTLRLRVDPPAGEGALYLSTATRGSRHRAVATLGRAQEMEVRGRGGLRARRTASGGMPVHQIGGGGVSGHAAGGTAAGDDGSGDPGVDIVLVSDVPAGDAQIVLYSTSPDAPGYTVMNVNLVEASVGINSFTADKTSIDNITAPVPVLLSWDVSNATTVTLSGVGTVQTVFKNFQVYVEQTTTFVLTAFDASLASISSQSVTVTVNPDLTSRMVAAGTILLWSGSLDSVPANWALCDGTQGTPDLRDRFVMGAGGGQAPNTSGDADTHTHSIAGLSSVFTTASAGAHTHGMPTNWYARSLSSGGKTGIDTNGTFNNNSQTQSAGAHTHTVPVSFAGFESSPNNGGVRPPWYALAYIMKLPYATS